MPPALHRPEIDDILASLGQTGHLPRPELHSPLCSAHRVVTAGPEISRPNPVAEAGSLRSPTTTITPPAQTNRLHIPEEITQLIIDHVFDWTTNQKWEEAHHLQDHQISDLEVPVAYRRNHLITRTLCSLALVCRRMRIPAQRGLYRYCVYIDSRQTLEKLIYSLRQTKGYGDQSMQTQKTWPLESMYLAPYGADINCVETTSMVHELFVHCAPTLSRLVIDMPLRSVYPEDDCLQIRPVLRSAFSKLVALESFVSCRDELYLCVNPRFSDDSNGQEPEPEVWASWPRLKRLALYNPDLSRPTLLQGLARLSLDHFYAARPDGFDVDLLTPVARRGTRLVVVDTVNGHADSFAAWQLPAEHELYQLMDFIDMNEPSDFDRENEIELVQAWLEEQAIDGSIWHTYGPPINCLLWYIPPHHDVNTA